MAVHHLLWRCTERIESHFPQIQLVRAGPHRLRYSLLPRVGPDPSPSEWEQSFLALLDGTS
jgi:hypothetical protein